MCYIHMPAVDFMTHVETGRVGGILKSTSPECVNLRVNEICVGLPKEPPSRHLVCPMQMRALAQSHSFAAGDLSVYV